MDIADFEHPAGRLVKARDEGVEYWAYVPNPLPPTLEFDLELVRALSKAEYALGELAGVGRGLPNPHLLIHPFIRREAVLSSKIEGTETDIAGLYRYEAGQLSLPGIDSPRAEADAREVYNYVLALEYGLEALDDRNIGLGLVCEMHRILMTKVRSNSARPGEFRTGPNYISGSIRGVKDARFVPPPVLQMQEALHALEQYVQRDDQYPPLVRIALVHYQFETIHPFEDGNGRIGRLLISLLLQNWNLLSHPLLYLSSYFERNREKYYDLLLGISARSQWRAWLLFFLEGVTEQAQDTITRAKKLQDLQQSWRNQFAHDRSAGAMLRLIDSLFSSPFLTIPLAQESLGVAYTTALRAVQKLVAAGILHQAGGISYGRWYVAEDVLRIIGE